MMTEEMEQYRREQAQRWLEHVAKLKHAVDDARNMRELFESLAENVKAVDYGRTPAGTEIHRLEEAICKVEDAAAQWSANQAAYIGEAVDAANRIAMLENAAERRALHLHYVDGVKWERVCVQMDYSWQRMMEIRRDGVLHVYEYMPLEWRDPMEPAI